MNWPQKTLAALQPINIEAEQAFLGALLTNADVYHKAQDVLCADDFYEGLHQRIYEAAAALIESGQSATPITLRAQFENDPAIKHVGGPAYLARLAAAAINCSNALDFARTIHELAARREIMGAARNCFEDAAYAKIDVSAEHLIGAYEADLAAIRDEFAIGQEETDAPSFVATLKESVARKVAGDFGLRVMSGLHDLDDLTGGFEPGQLIILAARPGMGKTTLAWRFIRAACQEGLGVSFNSLEMTRAEIGIRGVSDLSRGSGQRGIWYKNITRGSIDPQEHARVNELADTLASWPLEIDDRAALNMPQIKAQARRAQRRFARRETQLGLVIVDHLGHVRGTAYGDNRTLELGRITKDAKEMAKTLGVPVLMLCQLNRGLESRDDKRPTLADLRQSGEIEEDADKVLFLHREHYYTQRQKPNPDDVLECVAHQELCDKQRHEAEIIVAKNRGGELGSANVWCDMACNAFRNAPKNISGGY